VRASCRLRRHADDWPLLLKGNKSVSVNAVANSCSDLEGGDKLAAQVYWHCIRHCPPRDTHTCMRSSIFVVVIIIIIIIISIPVSVNAESIFNLTPAGGTQRHTRCRLRLWHWASPSSSPRRAYRPSSLLLFLPGPVRLDQDHLKTSRKYPKCPQPNLGALSGRYSTVTWEAVLCIGGATGSLGRHMRHPSVRWLHPLYSHWQDGSVVCIYPVASTCWARQITCLTHVPFLSSVGGIWLFPLNLNTLSIVHTLSLPLPPCLPASRSPDAMSATHKDTHTHNGTPLIRRWPVLGCSC
jgi:hypothetical protein